MTEVPPSRTGATRPRRWTSCASPYPHLLWTSGGLLTVEAEQRIWVVPTTLALWLPIGTHYIVTSSGGRGHQVATTSHQRSITWASPTVVGASGYVRESIARLADPSLSPIERDHIEAALSDALQPFPHSGLDLPVPSDARVRWISEALLVDPADHRTIADWGREVGASVRNLTRLFSIETGMTFAQWRLQARTRQAILALADDNSVGEVARSVGYSSTSAFVHAFRRTTGITPGAFSSTMRMDGQLRSAAATNDGSQPRVQSGDSHDVTRE